MKIVVAIDSMKGCLDSENASEAMKSGLELAFPDAKIISVPVADGGEGTAEAIAKANRGVERMHSVVEGPLGDPVNAEWWFNHDSSTAYMDMASAAGITLIAENDRNPLKTSTYGVGQLICKALESGADHIVVGMGGSATVDGGMGACRALRECKCSAEISLACDVIAPFTGDNGAARVFGPQKGATPEEVEILESKLEKIRQEVLLSCGIDLNAIPGSGAAGGCAGGLMAYCGAKIENGAKLVLDSIGFDNIVEDADLIVTGEGSADSQTLMGKLPSEILRRGKMRGIPVVLVAGHVDGAEKLLDAGFSLIIDINSSENINRSHTGGKDAMLPQTAKTRLKAVGKCIRDCSWA